MAKFAVIFCIILILVIQYTFAYQPLLNVDENRITIDGIIERLEFIMASDQYKKSKSEAMKLGEEIETIYKEIVDRTNET